MVTTHETVKGTPGVVPVQQSGAAHESTRVKGEQLAAKVKGLIHEGSVRRIVVKNETGHTVMEIPVTAGVIAAVALPILTAVGAVAALANDWTIDVHRSAT